MGSWHSTHPPMTWPRIGCSRWFLNVVLYIVWTSLELLRGETLADMRHSWSDHRASWVLLMCAASLAAKDSLVKCLNLMLSSPSAGAVPSCSSHKALPQYPELICAVKSNCSKPERGSGMLDEFSNCSDIQACLARWGFSSSASRDQTSTGSPWLVWHSIAVWFCIATLQDLAKLQQRGIRLLSTTDLLAGDFKDFF